MKQIYTDEKFIIYRKKQSLKAMYLRGIEHMYFAKKIRMFFSWLSGGEMVVLCDRLKDEPIGYCLVNRGRAFRYLYAEKGDITVGSIHILKEYRGGGCQKNSFGIL